VTDKMIITHDQVRTAALELATVCQALYRVRHPERPQYAIPERTQYAIFLYGVPRGGVPAAYALQHALLLRENCGSVVVQDPRMADFIIDDIEDSGATRAKYKERYPSTDFLPLFYARGVWHVFPWENDENTGTDQSATDIPIRLLQYIGEDVTRGGLKDTPQRFLKAWKEYTCGYGIDPGSLLKTFQDGGEKVDEMVLVRDIPVYSHCEHHLAPMFGVAHVAYIPDGQVLGLSKFARLVNVFARRLQVQERMTQQIAHALNEALQPLGVGVVLELRHLCMESRGVSIQGSSTTTSCLLGALKKDVSARAEFMRLVR
jgi:GTP cyclohydrolase I